MQEYLRWAILGAGAIADEMARTLRAMGRYPYAVASRTHGNAVRFAETHRIPKVYSRIEEMFADPAVDAVYIASPHNTHAAYMRAALQSGKHVLCEKSVTLNSRELAEAMALAAENRVVLAEAMTIWHMPLYQKLGDLVQGGALGRVRMLQVSFGCWKEYNMQNRFFNPELAGGALLDIGVYALSLARLFLSSQPDRVQSQVRLAPSGVDEQAAVLLSNREGEMAAISLSLHARQPKRAVISCEKGYIEITDFPRADAAVIVDAATGERRQVTAGKTADALRYELLHMERAVLHGETEAMRLGLTADVMSLMTGLRSEWGLRYPGEDL